MKHYLKIALNFLTSLLVIVSGTVPAAQANEMQLDFSVAEAEVVATSTTATKRAPLSVQKSVVSDVSLSFTPQLAADNSKKVIALKPLIKSSENAAKLIALDFGLPNANSSSTSIAAEVSGKTKPSNLKPIPPPKAPLAVKIPTSKPLRGQTLSKQVTALRRAIIGQESDGKFYLINPDSGALGYGQLMRENVAPWTKAALGKALTPEEFLANPELQIKTIDHKLNQYLQNELAYTGGSNEELAIRRVASTWYSGNPELWNNTRPQYTNGRRYPSIEYYTYSVWRRYLREIG